MRGNVLVSTLGNWVLIPELYGFTNIDDFNLYKNSANVATISAIRKKYNIQPVSEIWLIGTDGDYAQKQIEKVLQWGYFLNLTVKFRFFQTDGITDLQTDQDRRFMADLIYRVILNARNSTMHSRLILSLAGGRKTMSVDLQEGAMIFGCDIVMHIIADEIPRGARNVNLKDFDFKTPFPPEIADLVSPIVLFSDVETSSFIYLQGVQSKLSEYFFYAIEEINKIPNSSELYDLIESEKVKARHFIYNLSELMFGDVNSTNFMAIYALNPQKLNSIRNFKFGLSKELQLNELKILRQLPKTELHCHLGGILDVHDLIRVAVSNESNILQWYRKNKEYCSFIDQVDNYVSSSNIDAILKFCSDKKAIRNRIHGIPEPYMVAGLIYCFRNNPELLEQYIYGKFYNFTNFNGIGIIEYEQLGDLQGSGILQNECSLREALKILKEKTKAHNVKYLELRCSPDNYSRGELTSQRVYDIIVDELNQDSDCLYGILLIGSRHSHEQGIVNHVNLALNTVLFNKNHRVRLRGFDIAGDESKKSPAQLRELLLPLMQKCIKFTIHAGETVSVNSIWEAVYHLNADRIGHGLRLHENRQLLTHFIDRKITIELCPSSNYQIIGYKDNWLSDELYNEYPLASYLKEGLKVCINTDNPGISRTDFTFELLKAARLCRNGLSLWDILILIRNGFKASFADYHQKRELLRKAEAELVQLLVCSIIPQIDNL